MRLSCHWRHAECMEQCPLSGVARKTFARAELLILNEQKIADRSSRMDLRKNEDGSVDIYCGPKAPAGFETNWIPTVPGKNWFAYFRFYQPTEAYFQIRTFRDLAFTRGTSMDQRSAARHRILRAAAIEFGGSTIPCMVRNMSDAGAMLDLATTAEIPELFTLTVRADGHRTLCRLVWRNTKRIGVAFE